MELVGKKVVIKTITNVTSYRNEDCDSMYISLLLVFLYMYIYIYILGIHILPSFIPLSSKVRVVNNSQLLKHSI